jgi:MFS family permease
MAGATIWAARVVVFVAFLDLFIQFPVVAPYVRSLEASATFIGVVVGIYSATNLFGNVGAGAVLDRWGRKTPVLIGLLVTAASLASYTLAGSPAMLLVARAVHGLAAGVLTPGAFAMIGDATMEGRRGRAMGVSGATIAIAAVAGPPIGGIMRDAIGFEAVFLFGAALMVGAALIFWALARETAPSPAAGRTAEAQLGRYLRLALSGRMAVASVAALALTVSLGTLVTYLPLALEAQGESSTRSGTAFTAYAVVGLAAMASPLSQLSDRHGRTRLLAAGLALIAVGLLAMFAIPGINGATLGMAVFGLGFGLLFPAATALVADAATASERGMAFGIFYAVYSLGVVIGSVLSGVMTDLVGDLNGAPFLASALIVLASLPVVALIGRKEERMPVTAASPSGSRLAG